VSPRLASAQGPTPNRTGIGPFSRTDPESDSNRIFALTLGVALVVHVVLILGVRVEPPEPSARVASTIEVVVLRQPGPRAVAPDKVAAPAKTTQSGSGEGWRDATTRQAEIDGLPQPVQAGIASLDFRLDEPPREESAPQEAPAQQREPDLGPATDQTPPAATADETSAADNTRVLTTKAPADDALPIPSVAANATPIPPRQISATQILATRDQELARLAARIEDKTAVFGNRPRRTSISSSTKEYKYATYLEGWRRKVEQIGNLNYPEEARRKHLYGNLILRVAVRADGSVEQVQVLRPSSFKVLDEAAVHIVELAAPYAPFPPDIAAETDVLDITRTWQFQRNNQLGWGN
jgi:periplasmic protein TonB